jgi:type II secretory pathway pseudopilin PulG
MIKRETGFTLVELLVSMVMFVLVISAASQVFTTLLTQFKQQSKTVETQIEGIIGLEIMRYDVEHAGYGLPWNMSGAAYTETSVSPVEPKTSYDDRLLSDGPPNNPARGTDAAGASNSPGAFRSRDNFGFNGSDVFVVKSANVERDNTAHRWTRLGFNDEKRNGLSGDNFDISDRVIVIAPGVTDENRRSLVMSGGSWSTRYDNTAGFAPALDESINLVYGIKSEGSPAVAPDRPFNRADYYIADLSLVVDVPPDLVPERCATGTGVLYKGILSHRDNGGLIDNDTGHLPLLDCVADMQVAYILNSGAVVNADFVNSLTAAEVRANVRQVRIYILAHEGQRDPNFTFTNFTCGDGCIRVGEMIDTVLVGRDFTPSGVIDDFQDYRWKLYTLVVTPLNLEG